MSKKDRHLDASGVVCVIGGGELTMLIDYLINAIINADNYMLDYMQAR